MKRWIKVLLGISIIVIGFIVMGYGSIDSFMRGNLISMIGFLILIENLRDNEFIIERDEIAKIKEVLK